MRTLAWFAATATLGGAGGYVIVYLYRWEWHRAILVALLFLAAEVAVATVLVLRAGRRAASAPPPGRGDPDGRILEHIQASRPRRDHFAWLRPGGTTNVFIPVLLGAGALVSLAAFLLERLAARTAEPALERRLARELSGVAFPTGGLVAEDAELVAQDAPYADDPELRVLLAPLHRGG